MDTRLKIVNKELHFPKVTLVEPANTFYLQIAAEIDHSLFPFFLKTSKEKKTLINRTKEWCKDLMLDENVVNAAVFKAKLIPPGTGKFLKERAGKAQIPKYDYAILIEVSTKQKLQNIMKSKAYTEIIKQIKSISANMHEITATNVRRIGTVNHKKQGIFLFNYFYADDLEQNLAVWEYTAGWFQQETGLNNSTVLLPQGSETSNYKIINHCRWDRMRNILPALLTKKSFHTYVLDNFYANNVAAVPVLYKLA